MTIHLKSPRKLTDDQRRAIDLALHQMNKADWPVHPRAGMLACPCPCCTARMIIAALESMQAVDDEPAVELTAEPERRRIYKDVPDYLRWGQDEPSPEFADEGMPKVK